MSEKSSKYGKPRCGLCDCVIPEDTWDLHEKGDLHQSKLPKHEPVKIPVVPVRVVSNAEKKKNRSKTAKAENLGYYPAANGRSYWHCRCECGELVDVFAWRGQKRCPNCWKVIATHWMQSFWETTEKVVE